MSQQGGPKNYKGGHIFQMQYWMYAETGGPNMKWVSGTTAIPSGDDPVWKENIGSFLFRLVYSEI